MIHTLLFILGLAIQGVEPSTNKVVALETSENQAATVLVFVSSKCPCSKSHWAHLQSLRAKYPNFRFVGVLSNRSETLDSAKKAYVVEGASFPVLLDIDAKMAKQFRALKTPQVFVILPNGKVVYDGGVTNSARIESAETFYLDEVLSDLSKGKPPRRDHGRALGCYIQR